MVDFPREKPPDTLLDDVLFVLEAALAWEDCDRDKALPPERLDKLRKDWVKRGDEVMDRAEREVGFGAPED